MSLLVETLVILFWTAGDFYLGTHCFRVSSSDSPLMLILNSHF